VSARRALALVLALAATASGAIAPAPARAAGDTSAIAENTTDGSTLFRLAFDIRKVTGDVVDQTNAAVAYSSCTQCRTIAISIQILLVEGPATQFTPTNAAIAVNDQCNLCDSMALAYQFAVGGSGGELRFTPGGRREIAAINRELRTMPVEQLTDAEIAARVDALMDRVAGVLRTEVSTRDRTRPDEDGRRDRDRAPPGSGAPPPTADGSAPPPGETTPADTTPTTKTTPAPATTPAPTTTTPGETTTTPPPTDTTTTPATPAPVSDPTATTATPTAP
jgi:putative peptide zinc metalloprotease protein